MGNHFILNRQVPLDWRQEYEILDKNLTSDYLVLSHRATQEEYIGKQICSASLQDQKNIQHLIEEKKARPCRELSLLIDAEKQADTGYCNYQARFHLLYEKEATNLKEEKVKRQYSKNMFSGRELEIIIDSVVKGLMKLRELGQPHRKVSLSTIFIRQDTTIFLADPWLFGRDQSVGLDLNKNGYVYPSPEKIHFQNNLGDTYDPYLSDYYSLGVLILELIYLQEMSSIYGKAYRRINQEKLIELVSGIEDLEVKRKLKTLLSFTPEERKNIEGMLGMRRSNLNNEIANIKNTFQTDRNLHSFKEKISKSIVQTRPKEIFQPFVKMTESIESKYISNIDPHHPTTFSMLNQQSRQRSKVPDYHPYRSTVETERRHPKITFTHQNSSSSFTFDPNRYAPPTSDRPILEPPPVLTRQSSRQQLQKESIHQLDQLKESWPSAKGSNVATSQQNQEQDHNDGKIVKKFSHKERESPQIHEPQQYQHTSFNLARVKNSLEVKHKSEEQISLRSFNSFQHMFKDAISVNNSEDRSQLMSVVLGHDFGKESGGMGLFGSHQKMENSETKLPYPDHYKTLKQYPTVIEEKPTEEHLKTQEQQPDISIQEKPSSVELMPPQTPEHRPTTHRYNSTIREVSQQDFSLESVKGQLQQRVIEYEVGTKYVGQIKNGKRNGKGLFYYKDNSYYDGYWKDNKMHGRGSLYDSQDQLLYEGGWYMDNFHGKGMIFNDQPIHLKTALDHKNLTSEDIDQYWTAYQGDFSEGQKHGQGKLKLSNGEIYLGQFHQDMIQGVGKYYKLNGEVIEGRWSKGFLIQQYK